MSARFSMARVMLACELPPNAKASTGNASAAGCGTTNSVTTAVTAAASAARKPRLAVEVVRIESFSLQLWGPHAGAGPPAEYGRERSSNPHRRLRGVDEQSSAIRRAQRPQ